MNSDGRGNNRAIHASFRKSRHHAVYTFILTFSTLIFVSSMILTVYLTHIANMDMAVVLLIMGTCLLYVLSFLGNMYSIYVSKPNRRSSEIGETSNRLSQMIGTSDQSASTNVRPPDILGFPRARELFRKTPPPPYEVPMSEMPRMFNPGSSRSTESSVDREAEIAEEARKLITRMYEDFKRTDRLDEQSRQQMVQTPKTSVRLQETTSPKISQQNLIVQKQQTVAKSSPVRGLPSAGLRKNQVIQQVSSSSLPNQLDLGRLIIGSEGCNAAPLQLSPRNLGRLPVDFSKNQGVQQKVTPDSPQTQPGLERFMIGSEESSSPKVSPCISGSPSIDFRSNQVVQKKSASNLLRNKCDLEKFIVDSEGCAVAFSQPSHRRDILKAYKRKLSNASQKLQTRPKTSLNFSQVTDADKESENNEYEEIEVVGGIPSWNSSQASYDPAEYYCTENDLQVQSGQASSATSTASDPGPAEMNRKLQTPIPKERRLLSALSTRKLRQLGQSPETVLDAIATCFDLTPDEWMVAWKLCQQDVSPNERARILGVRLQEDSYNDDY